MHQPSIRVDYIGNERQPVVLIDNFSPHPQRLVQDAGTRDFKVLGPYYPGIRAPVSPLYFEGLGDVLAPIMTDVFDASNRIAFDRALYSLATTPPHELSLAQRIPHIDGVEPGMMAIIHYLSSADHGGTAFYRHRSTGFEQVTSARHRPYLENLRQDFQQHGEPVSAYIVGDTPIFEQIAAYEPTFNRALIYRGNQLHCARMSTEGHLSSDVNLGRLTVASFLTVS